MEPEPRRSILTPKLPCAEINQKMPEIVWSPMNHEVIQEKKAEAITQVQVGDSSQLHNDLVERGDY